MSVLRGMRRASQNEVSRIWDVGDTGYGASDLWCWTNSAYTAPGYIARDLRRNNLHQQLGRLRWDCLLQLYRDTPVTRFDLRQRTIGREAHDL
jgi:hypothetical protein